MVFAFYLRDVYSLEIVRVILAHITARSLPIRDFSKDCLLRRRCRHIKVGSVLNGSECNANDQTPLATAARIAALLLTLCFTSGSNNSDQMYQPPSVAAISGIAMAKYNQSWLCVPSPVTWVMFIPNILCFDVNEVTFWSRNIPKQASTGDI